MTYQLVFLINFLLSALIMKGISWFCVSPAMRTKNRNFFSTPFLSVRSMQRMPSPQAPTPLRQLFRFGSLLGIWILIALYLSPLNYAEILLVAPLIYFLTEVAAALGHLLFAWSDYQVRPIHDHPLKAMTLTQFWGRRWNLWIQDWLKDVRSRVHNQSRRGRIIITFAFSGLFHEVMVNLPYWVVFSKSYFGTMMLYFGIQSLALWIDKRLLHSAPAIVRAGFMWFALILPSPLFFNVPLLTFLGLSHA